MSYRIEEAGPVCDTNVAHSGTEAVMHNLLIRVPLSTNLGIYYCKDVRNNHPPKPGVAISLHGTWRAGDTGDPSQIEETSTGRQIVALLMQHREQLQIQRVIHAKRIWDCVIGWHDYNGTDPHFNHVHWELTHFGAALTAETVDKIFAEADAQEGNEMLILIANADQASPGTIKRGARYLLSGGEVSFVPDNDSANGLRDAGVKSATVHPNMISIFIKGA